jgi:hypothetical protein
MIGHHETHPAQESYEMYVLQDHQLNDFHKQKAVVSLHKMMVDFIINRIMPASCCETVKYVNFKI